MSGKALYIGRMDVKNLLLWAGAAYLVSKIAVDYAYKNFTLKKTSVKIGQLNLNGLPGKVFMQIENTTPAAITIQSIIGELLYNGNRIAYYSELSPTTLAPNATSTIELDFFVPYADITAAVTSAIAKGTFQTYATAKGLVRSAGVNIPFDMPISPF